MSEQIIHDEIIVTWTKEFDLSFSDEVPLGYLELKNQHNVIRHQWCGDSRDSVYKAVIESQGFDLAKYVASINIKSYEDYFRSISVSIESLKSDLGMEIGKVYKLSEYTRFLPLYYQIYRERKASSKISDLIRYYIGKALLRGKVHKFDYNNEQFEIVQLGSGRRFELLHRKWKSWPPSLVTLFTCDTQGFITWDFPWLHREYLTEARIKGLVQAELYFILFPDVDTILKDLL
jgi:hypothetical protein